MKPYYTLFIFFLGLPSIFADWNSYNQNYENSQNEYEQEEDFFKLEEKKKKRKRKLKVLCATLFMLSLPMTILQLFVLSQGNTLRSLISNGRHT